MITIETLRTLAENFLTLADELNDKVTAYINGSNAKEDADAYWAVREADKTFTRAYNSYFEENNEPCLNYELAQSVALDITPLN